MWVVKYCMCIYEDVYVYVCNSMYMYVNVNLNVQILNSISMYILPGKFDQLSPTWISLK